MNEETLRILLIDDDQGDYEMTRAIISQIEHPEAAYQVEWVATFEEGVDAFERNEHDVYFVDYFLEDRDGLELVREARRRGVREPVIMLTGRGSHEVDVEAMKAGASDYLVKGKVDPDLAERTIRYALERMRAEAALRDSEERHRGMFDHLPIGLYRVDTEGRFRDANPALVRILGHPDAEALESEYAANFYVAPGDRARFEELLERYGVARGFETTLRRADGGEVTVRNTARAHRGPDGEIQYLEGAVEDVTDIHSAEALRGSAARFETVFDHAALSILIADLDGGILKANPAFRRIFGYGPGEVQGRSLPALAAPDGRDDVEADLATVAREERTTLTGERRFLAGDGAELWTRMRATLIRDGDDRPDHLLVLLEDVAEH